MATIAPPTKKLLGTVLLLAGLIGATIGIWALDVVVAVAWLVLATFAGFYLLKLRAEARGRL